jgi:hypothetical protein
MYDSLLVQCIREPVLQGLEAVHSAMDGVMGSPKDPGDFITSSQGDVTLQVVLGLGALGIGIASQMYLKRMRQNYDSQKGQISQ